jgi:hypothetical protein
MANQSINIGSGELTGDGESIRSAFDKVNDNFDELYAANLSVDAQFLEGNPGAFYLDYTNFANTPQIPLDVSDLTDSTNLLAGGGAGGIALTDLSVVTNPAGTAALTYDNTSGVFTYTPPDLTAYTDADVDTHLNTSTATANQILSWDGADYAWVADQTGSASSASNLIAWDLADTANSKVLDAGTVADSAWYYGDVISDPANPATSVVLDISAATFAGNVMGEVHGDVKTADGGTLILDVDAGVGTAMYYGDVTGNITSSGTSEFSGTVDFTSATVTGLSSGTYDDTDVATYLNGNLDTSIIPDTNATYDIGSAEKKVRHFYLSDNSLKFTDTTDPLNIVEYSVGRTGTDITFNGSALKSTSSEDVADAGTIDITKTNHFVTNGTTAVLPDGTYLGQKLEFWRSAGAGNVDITVNSAIYMDGSNVATGPGPIVWRLGNANQTLYSCIWNGVAWVLSHGGPGV